MLDFCSSTSVSFSSREDACSGCRPPRKACAWRAPDRSRTDRGACRVPAASPAAWARRALPRVFPPEREDPRRVPSSGNPRTRHKSSRRADPRKGPCTGKRVDRRKNRFFPCFTFQSSALSGGRETEPKLDVSYTSTIAPNGARHLSKTLDLFRIRSGFAPSLPLGRRREKASPHAVSDGPRAGSRTRTQKA